MEAICRLPAFPSIRPFPFHHATAAVAILADEILTAVRSSARGPFCTSLLGSSCFFPFFLDPHLFAIWS
jgi:hypothetical protein